MESEPGETALYQESAKLLFALAKDILGAGGRKLRQFSQIELACTRYLEKYLQRHGQVKVLGMRDAVPLIAIYTAVRFLTEDYRSRYATIDALQNAFRERGRGFSQGLETAANGLRVAKHTQFLSVLGEPGAGKSTFLRRVGLEALLSEQFRFVRRRQLRFSAIRATIGGLLIRFGPERPRLVRGIRNLLIAGFSIPPRSRLEMCIPVYIELKTFRNRPVNLTEVLRQEFTTCGFPDGFSDLALARGNLLVLLDGIDEIPSDKIDEAILHIREFVDRHDANRFIISCRTHFYHAWFPRFKDVILADFDDSQIEAFAHNWFAASGGSELGEQFVQLLSEPRSAATRELARTPLLLTFLCLVYEDSQGLPVNRSDLYEEALKILMTKWAAEKRVRHEDIYAGLTPGLELLLLQRIAGSAFEEDKLFFRGAELISAISDFLRTELNAPKHLDAEKVLDAIQNDQGLFVERAHGIFSFSHLTLQEYLSARFFLGIANSGGIVERYLFSPHWREVFLLLAGMTEVDNLLRQMAQACHRLVSENKTLAQLLDWSIRIASDQVRGPRGAARRAISLSMVLSAVLSSRQNKELESRLGTHAQNTKWALTAPKISTSRDIASALSYRLDNDIDIDPRFLQSTDLDNVRDIKDVYYILAVGRERGLFKKEVSEKMRESLHGLLESIPEAHAAVEPRIEYSEKVKQRLFAAFRFFLEDSLPADEIGPIDRYLYGMSLIVDCRVAALSVSAAGWEEICDMLFTTAVDLPISPHR
jgi:hypothetical protein